MADQKELLARAGREPEPERRAAEGVEPEARQRRKEGEARMSEDYEGPNAATVRFELEEVATAAVAVNARLAALEAEVAELTHDLVALVTLAGQVLGQPFAAHAKEIVSKRQLGDANASGDRVARRKAGAGVR